MVLVIPTSELTLNLLRQSRLNPKLSAYAQLHGVFDFNKTPLAPPGCEIIAFLPPSQRTSWGCRGYKAWYTRPAMEHYRCIHEINEKTGKESTIETVQYLPHNVAMPAFSSHDLAIKAAHDLTSALASPHPAAPFLPPHPQHAQDLRYLATIFSEMANPKPTHEPPPRVPASTIHNDPVPAPRVVMQAHHATDTILPQVLAPMQPTPLHMVHAVYDNDSEKTSNINNSSDIHNINKCGTIL